MVLSSSLSGGGGLGVGVLGSSRNKHKNTRDWMRGVGGAEQRTPGRRARRRAAGQIASGGRQRACLHVAHPRPGFGLSSCGADEMRATPRAAASRDVEGAGWWWIAHGRLCVRQAVWRGCAIGPRREMSSGMGVGATGTLLQSRNFRPRALELE